MLFRVKVQHEENFIKLKLKPQVETLYYLSIYVQNILKINMDLSPNRAFVPLRWDFSSLIHVG